MGFQTLLWGRALPGSGTGKARLRLQAGLSLDGRESLTLFFLFYARIAQRAYAPKGWKALGPQGSNPKWSVDQPKVGFTHRVVYPDRRLDGVVTRCSEMRESKAQVAKTLLAPAVGSVPQLPASSTPEGKPDAVECATNRGVQSLMRS